MFKVIEVNKNNFPGEKLCHRVTSNIKLAAEKTEAMKYADSVKKESPENEIIIVVALTIYEKFGSNDNGDGFPTEKYPGIEDKDLLQNHYDKFESGAHVYYQHASGEEPIGKVHKSFYNTDKGWVELVIEVFANKATPDVIDRIKNNEMVSVSMGCDVAYDVCSICGHKAKSTSDHCIHIKEKLHELVNGKVVSMLCPSPRFFDISVVTVGADSLSVSFYRKVAALKGTKKDHTFSNKMAELLFNKKSSKTIYANLFKLNSIYKGIESGNTYLNTKLKDLVSDTLVDVKNSKADSVFDDILFYTHLGLPYPLKKVCNETGLSMDSILEEQDRILRDIQSSEEAKDKFMEFVKKMVDEVTPSLKDENLYKLLKNVDKNGIKSLSSLVPSKENVALFNLINKLSILGKSNLIKSRLSDPNLKNLDLSEIVSLEYLMY